MGSILALGVKILYAMEQLSPPATVTEPARFGACVPQMKPMCLNEKKSHGPQPGPNAAK